MDQDLAAAVPRMPYSSTPCRLVTAPGLPSPLGVPVMLATVLCPMLTRPACSGTGRVAVFGQQTIHATVDHPWRVRAVVAGIITFKLDARAMMDELVACQTLGADIVKTGRPISSHHCRMAFVCGSSGSSGSSNLQRISSCGAVLLETTFGEKPVHAQSESGADSHPPMSAGSIGKSKTGCLISGTCWANNLSQSPAVDPQS
ncbi:hypothetical protein EDB80DRAFT_64143 [Ilyonectria destructans]|nr:hypothetical protein EDB80DRAFT_64143 [Ilyonectria destructans]